MNCTNHPELAAEGVCTYCGKYFCKDCLVEVDGKMVCKDDVTRMYQDAKATAQAAPAAVPVNVNVSNINTNTNTNTNILGGAGNNGVSRKSRMVTLILAIFLGTIGAHRFYVGKIGSGCLYLFTGGLFFVGWIYDIIKVATGTFRDGLGLPITK